MNLEKLNQPQAPIFDFEKATLLAQEKIKLEGDNSPEAKQKKSLLKNQINNLYGTSEDETPMRYIFDLEVEYQKLSQRLKEVNQVLDKFEVGKRIERKDRDKLIIEGARPIEYVKERNQFNKVDDRGNRVRANLSDLITDISWGNYYEFDDTVPVKLQRQYYEKYISHKMSEIDDKQTIMKRRALELNPAKKRDQDLIDIYEKVEQRGELQSPGLLFERMIKNILTKIVLEFPNWGIKIWQVSVYDDVEKATDFLIEFDVNMRGVRVEETDQPAAQKKLGIQFTIVEAGSSKYQFKEGQIHERKKKLDKEMDDLVLVSIPLGNREIMDKYHDWQKLGRPAGGPENMFSEKDLLYFLAQLLQQTDYVEANDRPEQEFVLKKEYSDQIHKYLENKR